MTNDEREQVVELLRCAADASTDREHPIIGPVLASWWLGHRDDEFTEVGGVVGHADHAWLDVVNEPWSTKWPNRSWFDYRDELLEAAARVEEGSWP